MSEALVARYEVRVGISGKGKKGRLCGFGDDYTDIIVIDKKTKNTLAWNIEEVKKKIGLLEDNYKVIPYLLNELLIRMQETDFSKAKKAKKSR